MLELIALGTLPFGAARYPEWGSAAVVGGGVMAARAPADGALALAMLAALATAALSSWSLGPLRRFIARRAAAERPALDAGTAAAVTGLQLLGLTADATRAGVVTLAGLAVSVPATAWLSAHWRLGPVPSRAVPVALATAVAFAAVWNVVHLTKGARWYLAGGLLAAAALLALGAR